MTAKKKPKPGHYYRVDYPGESGPGHRVLPYKGAAKCAYHEWASLWAFDETDPPLEGNVWFFDESDIVGEIEK